MAKGNASAGIYSATYSGIPVWEYQFGVDLKEHVMRRRSDDWINATHILKAAGFDKPARTRILEREVQKDTHEKIQGGYGKYQGTWIPLEHGEALAHRNNTYAKLRPIFEFQPGNESPPPAPRHTSKPKQPKPKPAVPTWNNVPTQADYSQHLDTQIDDDGTPDNLTVASASYMAEDDHTYDVSQMSTGHRDRKRKRDEANIQDLTEQQHAVYGDELLDYFLLSRNEQPTVRPDPPTNFKPDWIIDTDGHTALHWASAMGDIEVVKQLKRFNATLSVRNLRGETPFMRAVHFTNCYEKQTFPQIIRELFTTVDARDNSGCTVIHHAAVMKSGRFTSQSCSRYYLDNILNRLQETHDPQFAQQLIDAQDNDGNTAVHLAAQRDARKCIRALLGRGASTDIPNKEGVRAEDMIKELNASKSKTARAPQRSSSPFAPESNRRMSTFHDALGLDHTTSMGNHHGSTSDHYKAALASAAAPQYKCEAANTVSARITPLVLDKFADLAACYEADFGEKDEAEREARRVLANTQADLQAVRQQLAELEPQLEQEEVAEKVRGDVAFVRGAVAGLVQRQNWILVGEAVQRQQQQQQQQDGGMEVDEGSPEERLKLASELHTLLAEQRRAEAEYVDALGAVGTGERIDKYRRLLRDCLGPEDMESLDVNLEDLIKMMQEEADVGGSVGPMGGLAGLALPAAGNGGPGDGGETMEVAAM